MDLKQFLDDLRNGKLNAEQRAQAGHLLHDKQAEPELEQLIEASLDAVPPVEAEETQAYAYESIREKYLSGHPSAQSRPATPTVTPAATLRTLRYRAAAAAVMIVLLGAGFYIWRSDRKQPRQEGTQQLADVQPGKSGAVLTLADGSRMVLDSLGNGIIAHQQGADVLLKDGRLNYNGRVTAAEIAYNTITTPRGRQFQVQLQDGTKAWLNAGSSLRYPTVFSGTERNVEIEGEVYFEVAPNARQPFFVTTPRSRVEVLGTSFNVNAYNDGSAEKTTLLEGSVRVRIQKASAAAGNNQAVVLQPGEQTRITGSGETAAIKKATVHTESVIAWKNGAFNFNDVTLVEAMHQIERWYDIQVVFEGEGFDIPTPFSGKISRKQSLNSLLRLLHETDLVFRMENEKMLIIKK